jgi:hypothetical protein
MDLWFTGIVGVDFDGQILGEIMDIASGANRHAAHGWTLATTPKSAEKWLTPSRCAIL